jgi:hypothetical protein
VQAFVPITELGMSGRMGWIAHNDGLHSARVSDATATFFYIGAGQGRWRVRSIGSRGQASPASSWRTFFFSQ